MKTILIIGQGPSKSGEGRPSLEGQFGSGKRLAELSGVSAEKMHELADCVNLLDSWHGTNGKSDHFPMKLAREKAPAAQKLWQNYERVVLLGSNVAESFRFECEPLTWQKMEDCSVAIVPHPSGVNRWYNDEQNKADAAAFLRSLFSECNVPVEGVVLTKQKRAEEVTERLEEYDRRSDWVELAVLLVECEREKLFLEVGCKTWDEWLRKHAPRSYRLCYMIKAQYKALEGALTLEEMRRIPPETARWAAKAGNLSPAALNRPEVKAALMQPKRKAIAEIQGTAPDQHVEDEQVLTAKFADGAYDEIMEEFEMFKHFKDEKAGLSDFLQFVAFEWADSLADESESFREKWEAMKGTSGDQAKAEAAAQVAAV